MSLAWMQKLCRRDLADHWSGAPGRLVLDGDPLAVVTDGHMMVICQQDSRFGRIPKGAGVETFLAPPLRGSHQCVLGCLLGWAKAACHCRATDAVWWGTVLGQPFNRRLIEKALRHFDGDQVVDVGFLDVGRSQLGIETTDWRAVVMNMSFGHPDAPEFKGWL